MRQRLDVRLSKTSPRFLRFDPHKNLVLVFIEGDRKRRFLVPTHVAIGKACMKVLKDRLVAGMLGEDNIPMPEVPQGFSQEDVNDIEKKRFSELPRELKKYKAKFMSWLKLNNAFGRAQAIIKENDLDAARDMIEERGHLQFERYKFQTLEDIE